VHSDISLYHLSLGNQPVKDFIATFVLESPDKKALLTTPKFPLPMTSEKLLHCDLLPGLHHTLYHATNGEVW